MISCFHILFRAGLNQQKMGIGQNVGGPLTLVNNLITCFRVCVHMQAHGAPLSPQYENETYVLKWGPTELSRPHWSDEKGKIEQPMEAFDPPPVGWRWEGKWIIDKHLELR